MKFALVHSVAPLAALAFVALTANVVDVPTFAPQEGLVLDRTLTMSGTRDLRAESMEVGDERQTNPDPFTHIEIAWKHVVVDEFVKCTEERVSKLKRTYETLEKSRTETRKDQAGAEKSNKVVETCALEGKSVLFVWDAEKNEYAKSFAGEGDEELPADIEADMDYREFLPEKDAEIGAKWERDFADVKLYLLRPGGDLPFKSEVPPRPLDLRMRAAVWDATSGKVAFTWMPDTELDGKKLAKIHFKGTNKVEAVEDAKADEKGPSRLAVSDDQTFEGDLLWDTVANRAHSLEWSAKGTMVLKVSLPAKSPGGEDATVVQAFTFDTAYDYTASFEVQ
ncbi:MAG: hypothetical protein SGI72_07030 [Planctomycetota bacterium]|nr:hypothetical protein [Planctomycetota bacterium]